MVVDLLSNNLKTEVNSIKEGIKGAFKQVRQEFDEHLDTINQNTNEIQSVYEYCCELDSKINKVSEKIDEMMLALIDAGVMKSNKKKYNINEGIALSNNEQEVFLVVYGTDNDISYENIVRRTGLPVNMIKRYITNLIKQGIPIIKKYNEGTVFLNIDSDFKRIQTKHNILNIDKRIAKKCFPSNLD